MRAFGGRVEIFLGSAYTPGLTVSADIVVQRIRRLPIKGEVLVKEGDHVEPDTVVAEAKLPGLLQTIRLAERLGLEAREIPSVITFQEGFHVEKGQVLAETKGFLFGIGKASVVSEYSGVVESISAITGNILVREASIPVSMTSYVAGKVAKVMPEEGAVIETRGAMIQGIFGVGGERVGQIRCAVPSGDAVLDEQHIEASDKGKILVGGAGVTMAALKKANSLEVAGLVVGAVRDVDLIELLGYDIGVAITGQEEIATTLIATEGFGQLRMAERTFQLFKSLEGRNASMNGATQIRAGVIRPEIIAPNLAATGEVAKAGGALSLENGTAIRIIREPYFGRIGAVTGLPTQLQKVESETEVRVLTAKLDDGQEVCVPRANVEIIAT